MLIFCDICEKEVEYSDVESAETAGWIAAEDEPDAVDRHGLCADCQEENEELAKDPDDTGWI